MLRSCLPYLGSPNCVDNTIIDESKSKELEEAAGHHGHNNNHNNNNNSPSSFVSSNNSKHIFVRVVHAGGKVDHYPNAVLAAKLLESLPGKWLTHPQVFKQPHQSIVYPQEYLLPGHKYYVLPLSTIDKLMRKHSNNNNSSTVKFVLPPNNITGINRQIDMGHSEANIDHDGHTHVKSMDDDDISFYSAREFYANKHKRSTSSATNGTTGDSRKPRILLPNPKPKPKPKPKPCSAYTWEPGLTSIQELSP